MSQMNALRAIMKGQITRVVFIVLFAGSVNSPLVARTVDPVSLYGNEISFDVFRNGEKVGRHDVSFSKITDGNLRVTSRFELKITFLTFTVFDYLYRSTATWRDGQLTALDADVIEDDHQTTVRASLGPGGMEVFGPKKLVRWQGWLYPTNHWNAGVLSSRQVLNTISGDIANVTIKNMGRETIRAEGRSIDAVKYQYSGDLEPTVWYDDRGRWVKMRFSAKDGSTIDYECTRCGIGDHPRTQSG